MMELQFFMGIFVAAFVAVKSQGSGNPVVSTVYGNVEGYRYTTPNGFETEVFLGIPYATPPIGNLRFEKSKPPTPWTTTRQAKTFGAACLTLSQYSPVNSSEDCLFINIVKPTAPSTDPKGYPTLLWVHGGAFLVGSGGDKSINATAERLVEKGVIYASLNFRQAAFGFFTTGDSKAPGNYGLWDQVQALKFLKKVIKQFGGNPKKIVPFGQSSGGIAVSLLSLAPATKNLFDRSIDMSGSSNMGLQYKKWKVPEFSKKLTDALGCGCATNPKTCLKTKTSLEIQNGMASYIKGLDAGFWVRMDGDLLPDTTYADLVASSPKRDMLFSLNNQEYLVFATTPTQSNDTIYPISTAKAANFSAADFAFIVNKAFATPVFFGNKSQEVSEKIINFYLNQTHYDPNRNFYLQIYAQLITDTAYNIRTMREAKYRAAAGQKVYFTVNNYIPPSYINALFEGTGHSRELYYLFGTSSSSLPYIPLVGDVAAAQKTYSDLFVTFSNTGIPSSDALTAPQVTNTSVPNVQIYPSSFVQQDLWKDRIDFWDMIATTYGYDFPESSYV